ncbi:MAG: hypothetical protein WC371_05510 [Parachlamydiales bacterium]
MLVDSFKTPKFITNLGKKVKVWQEKPKSASSLWLKMGFLDYFMAKYAKNKKKQLTR